MQQHMPAAPGHRSLGSQPPHGTIRTGLRGLRASALTQADWPRGQVTG